MAAKRVAKRIYLVNRDFQVKYIVSLSLVAMLTTLLTIGTVLYPLYQFGILRVPTFLPPLILTTMAAAVICNIAIIGISALYITHRIAGPMFALSRKLRQIEGGQWNAKLQIRENDDLRYVVRNFNNMVDGLLNQGEEMLALIEKHQQGVPVAGADSTEIQQLKDYLQNRMSGVVRESAH